MPPVVRAPAPPCPTRPGEIVGLVLQGTGAPAGTVVVFGHAFRAGDLPRGAALGARLAGGAPLPAQADITARHADGSARFAVVSLATPALAPGARTGVLLTATATTPSPPLDIVAAAAGRGAMIEITPEGGNPWRADLLLRLQDGLLDPARRAPWQQGPLAVQGRVALPIPPAAVGGATSARLVADVSLHADGTLWVDAWVRNDIAMQPGGGTARYAMRLLLDGQEAFTSGPVAQLHYTGLGRRRGTLRGRPAPAPPLVCHDVAYLAAAAAVAPFDRTVGVAEALLARMAQFMAAPDWDAPFAPRRIVQDMGSAGGRPDIGPTTLWQAAWLVSGDARAARFAEDQAEAGGAIPWHFWDSEANGGAGGWLDTRRWPQLWTDPRGGRPPRTLAQPIPPRAASGGWVADTAHKPALGYVPHLLTGRRAFLDEVQAEAMWAILSAWPARRAETDGVEAVRDLNLVAGGQLRGAAWSLRDLDNAGFVVPDADPQASYLRDAAAANWAWVRAMTGRWGARQGEARGWIMTPHVLGNRGETSPWQQEFFVAAAAAAARRGNDDARAVLAWMENFIVGRFQAGARGFNPRDGIAYQILVASAGGVSPALFQTWAEIGEATRAANMSNNDGWGRSAGYYGPLGRHSLALLAEVLDSEAARRAHAWLVAAAPPFTTPRDYAADPTYNVLPPGPRPRGCAG